jgi:hypothetical protein
MKLRVIPFVIATLVLASCAESSKTDNQTTNSETSPEGTTEQAPKPTELGLNDGAKWEVNPEMMVFVDASEQLVADFSAASKESYAELVTGLEKNRDALISSCTMKGASHDALHLWLEPYMGQINQLKTAENEEEKSKTIAEIKASFQTFHSYFE